MSRRISFTLDADAVQGDTWNVHIGQLVELASRCTLIDVARTTGARREASAGGDAAADRRRVLMERLPEVRETVVICLTRLGEGALGSDEDQAQLSDIRRALGLEKRKFNRSDDNDVLHLATHVRARRDYFVTTDQRVHAAREELIGRGIQVVAPDEALALAPAACESSADDDLAPAPRLD